MLQSTAAESHLPKERKAGGLSGPWWMCWKMFGGGGERESEGDSDTKKICSNIHFEHQIWYPKESHKKNLSFQCVYAISQRCSEIALLSASQNVFD